MPSVFYGSLKDVLFRVEVEGEQCLNYPSIQKSKFNVLLARMLYRTAVRILYRTTVRMLYRTAVQMLYRTTVRILYRTAVRMLYRATVRMLYRTMLTVGAL